MQLITHCDGCKEIIPVKSNASTRPDLEMEKGEVFVVNCQKCGKMNSRHVNDIYARINKWLMLGIVGVSLVVTLVLWSMIGLISTITAVIPALAYGQQNQAVSGFNRYKVRRKK